MSAVPILKFKKLTETARIPERKTEGAAAFDIWVDTKYDIWLYDGEPVKISTGVAVEIPPGYCGLVLPRSSYASQGLQVYHPPVDSDYRGELFLLCGAASNSLIKIQPGDRIAQLLIIPTFAGWAVESEQLSETERGTGAFGSTGNR